MPVRLRGACAQGAARAMRLRACVGRAPQAQATALGRVWGARRMPMAEACTRTPRVPTMRHALQACVGRARRVLSAACVCGCVSARRMPRRLRGTCAQAARSMRLRWA